MFGLLIAVSISFVMPVGALIYAWRQRKVIPFILGAGTFIFSQILVRIPILEYLSQHSTNYSLLQAMQPVLFAVLLGLSAGVAEELARYAAMRFLMKARDWQSGFLFGMGHGGMEAILFVGINALFLLFSPEATTYGSAFLIGGVERFFAIMLHVGLSFIVMRSVSEKKFRYTLFAVLIHGLADALVGLIPLWVPADQSILITEIVVALIAAAVFGYGLRMKKRGVLN